MSSKQSKTKDTTEKKPKIWRASGVIDRSKRIGKVPSEVDPSNIVEKTRSRKDYVYAEPTKKQYEFLERDEPRESINLMEKRLKAAADNKENAKDQSKKDSVSDISKSMKKMRIRKSKEGAKKDTTMTEVSVTEEPAKESVKETTPEQVKEPEPSKPVLQEQVKPVETAQPSKSETKIRSRRRSRGSSTSQKDNLSDAVLQEVQRLQGTFKAKIEERNYSGRSGFIPPLIQAFLDVAWKTNKFAHKDFSGEAEIGEFDLPEDERQGSFFDDSPDYILFAEFPESEVIIATRESESSSDFTVFVVDPEGAVKKQYTLSKFLKGLSVSV